MFDYVRAAAFKTNISNFTANSKVNVMNISFISCVKWMTVTINNKSIIILKTIATIKPIIFKY